MIPVVVSVDHVITTLKFTSQRIDDWEKVEPEAQSLSKMCKSFQELIKDLVDKPDLPIHDELQEVQSTLEETNKVIQEFLDEDGRKGRSAWDEAGWQVRRVFLAYQHRATFKATTQQLQEYKVEFVKILKFSRVMSTPTAYWFKDSMINEDCFRFWKTMCGEGLETNWATFAKLYQQQYDVEWDGVLEERIRREACSGEDTPLTLAGYISLTNKCGFPLTYNALPQLIDSHATVSAQTRMEVARMINELITYYSTKEMRDLLVSIFAWYQGCPKHERQAVANTWAETIKANRGKRADQLNERDRLAEQVDMARRTYSFFFQRYMVVFKIGQLSKEMFAEVDFPGKARMYEFIDHVKPLDHANFHIIIRGNPDEWESKKPKVYTFLQDFIQSEKKAKQRKKDAAIANLEVAKDPSQVASGSSSQGR